jgi:hypothetical protein
LREEFLLFVFLSFLVVLFLAVVELEIFLELDGVAEQTILLFINMSE